MRLWALAAAVLVLTHGVWSPARAGSRQVQYGPPGAWVAPPPAPTAAATQPGAVTRVAYADQQTRLTAGGQETYTAVGVKLLTPTALALGHIVLTWSPTTDDLIVHRVSILRGGKAIDVLAATKFQVIERENNLEYSMLDGDLTANLQVPGLEIGDELELAWTVRRHDPTFGGRYFGFAQLPVVGAPGAYRLRLLWDPGQTVRRQTSADMGLDAGQEPRVAPDGEKVVTYELRDPDSAILAEGAPARVNVRRLIEYSQFSSWAEVSNALAPLFEKAAELAPDSPLRAQAAQIAASTPDPKLRVQAALRLVEDQIRYVFVGLNGGAYRPASADETWTRRFGDCKAKAVLLLALLRQLGIPAEAVLVNTQGGDGTDQRLPTPAAFDHVVVRASLGAKRYWLDATRLGDRDLEALPAPVFRWALPVRAGPVKLEAVPGQGPARPQVSLVLDIDARAGFARPAAIRAEEVLRGDEVAPLRAQLSSLSPQDADRALQGFWRQQIDWIQPGRAGWGFDALSGGLVLTMSGSGRPAWEGDETQGRSLDVPNAGFTPPNFLRRPKEQDQTAPWSIQFPRYDRWTTIIRLPPPTAKWRWSYAAAPVDERLGGVWYWRQAQLKDGVLRTTMSIRALSPEITAAQARELDEGLPKFDNKVSQVFQVDASASPEPAAAAQDEAVAEPGALAAAALAARRLAAGRTAEALTAADEAVSLAPQSLTALRLRAQVLDRLGRRAEAREDLDEAWRIDPLDPATERARAAAAPASGTQTAPGEYDPWRGAQAPAPTAAGELAMTTEPAATAPHGAPSGGEAAAASGNPAASSTRQSGVRERWIAQVSARLKLDAPQKAALEALVTAPSNADAAPTLSPDQVRALPLPQRLDDLASRVSLYLARVRAQAAAAHRL